MNEIEVFKTKSLKLPVVNQTQSSRCSDENFALSALKCRKLDTSKNESQYISKNTYHFFQLSTVFYYFCFLNVIAGMNIEKDFLAEKYSSFYDGFSRFCELFRTNFESKKLALL